MLINNYIIFNLMIFNYQKLRLIQIFVKIVKALFLIFKILIVLV